MKFMVRSLALAAILGLAACAGTPDGAVEDTSSQDSQDTMDGGLSGSGVDGRGMGEMRPIDEAAERDAALRRQLTIYFDFDSSQIADEYMPVLDAHARYLRENPNARIRLEGHSDERGTREYNIALGERRGEAVRRALLLRGATRAQLLVVSFGEERPAVLGSSEAAWAKNRRVGLMYQ